MRPARFLIVPLALLLAACGGGTTQGQPPASHPVTVSVGTDHTTLTVETPHQFTAAVSGTSDPAILWSVQESGGGSVDPDGIYTPPAATGTYHVVAASHAHPASRAVITVDTIAAPSIAAFSVDKPEILGGQSVALTATFSNGTAVIDHGVGAVTSGVAASTAPSSSTVFVLTVTNSAGSSVSSGLAVMVDQAVAVGVVPNAAALNQGASQQFLAVVSGAGNEAVNWSVQEAGGGSVSAGGLYTPPAKGGVYHVVATSLMDPTKQAVATVTVARAWSASFDTPDPGSFVIPNAPQIASNDAGDLLLTWYSAPSVRARIFRSDTQAWGPITSFAYGGVKPLMDASGNAWLIFASNSGSPGMTAARYNHTTGTWGAIANIPGNPVSNLQPSEFDADVAPDGSVGAAWTSAPSAGGNSHLYGAVWRPGPKAWGSARQLDGVETGNCSGPKVGASSNGMLVAWWQPDSHTYPQIRTNLWKASALAWKGDVYRTSTPLDVGYPVSYLPTLAVTSNGDATLAFRQIPGASLGGLLPDDGMSLSYTASTDQWSTSPRAMESGPGQVILAIALARGVQTAAFCFQVDGLGQRVIFSPGTLPSPFDIPYGASRSMALGGDGRTAVGWMDPLSGMVYVSIHDPATDRWTDLFMAAAYNYNPEVGLAMDGQGRAFVAWTTFDGTSGTGAVHLSTYQ